MPEVLSHYVLLEVTDRSRRGDKAEDEGEGTGLEHEGKC